MKLPNVNTITQQEFLDHIEDDDFYMWKWLSQFLVITRVRAKDERVYPDWQRTLSDKISAVKNFLNIIILLN